MRINCLCFVNGEEQVGGGAHDHGVRLAGEELETGIAKQVHVAPGCMPAATRAETGIEGMADANHVVGRLGFEGGRDRDNAPTHMGVTEEQPGKDMGLELVLAGLAGKDDDKGEAQIVKDGFFDGKGNATLVGAEVDAAGGSPTDGVAADGLADSEGEGRLRIGYRYHRNHMCR
jgi:hypothetical protein